MSEFSEKARSVGFGKYKGTSQIKPKINEETGKPGGYEREHWDDSQDAVVAVEPVVGRREA